MIVILHILWPVAGPRERCRCTETVMHAVWHGAMSMRAATGQETRERATCARVRQRPNLKSQDSGLRHRFTFSEAKVSLWMCENGTGREESRGPTRR